MARLYDLGFSGHIFTWRRGNVWERIDRALANDHWLNDFLYTTVSHLSMTGYDHRPLLISINSSINSTKANFIYLNVWSSHPDFMNQVTSVWAIYHNDNPWVKLWILHKKLAAKLTSWNWQTFDNLNTRVVEAEAIVNDLEYKLSQNPNFETDLYNANEGLLNAIHLQEQLLHQKATQNHWGTETQAIIDNAVEHFQKLFTKSEVVRTEVKGNLFDHCRHYTSTLKLADIPSEEEIKTTLNSIDSNKAAGLDGFSADFYKTAWNVIKSDDIDVVQAFFTGQEPIKYFTSSIIVLITKETVCNRWDQFRPISLTSVISKIISKVLVARIQPHLNRIINNNQTAFIKGRSIVDNVLLSHELYQDLDKRCRGREYDLQIRYLQSLSHHSLRFF
ncbi:uncharacterized protein LOC110039215 [Phalaenopsis equestris]|uniref:uncharacterized protein LOC110039215 n=1 Tax=Phalaenopsis equestris TaxID=78828 RepID=UPI0009E3E100|nr:uncharacterized protein LOC110039215 [Phalaenopsis equestris]